MKDIIILGATGFTGKRAVQYLADHAGKDLSWGIAGRNRKKLDELAAVHGINEDRIFQVDTLKKKQVEHVVSQCRILVTTAGPFSLYGKEVVRACAETGTHYLDITGEVDFIRDMISEHKASAEKSGSILIPFSGFDSVPADIGSYLSASHYDEPEELVIRSYYSVSGGFNGGTIATMMNKFETGAYKKTGNPKILGFETEQTVDHEKGGKFVGFDPLIKRWTVPFIMGAINSKVVYKTADTLRAAGKPYANKITYSEHSALGKKSEPFSFLILLVFLTALTKLGPYKWFRSIIKKFSPAPGEGPDESAIENGFMKVTIFSTDNKSKAVKYRMYYPGDPGNKATIFFLCESAMLLHEITQKTPGEIRAGFHTPVSAFGKKLIERLQENGLIMELVKDQTGS